jgi:hypothetical protein
LSLGAWMALEDVAPVLAKQFVTLTLDADRSKGAMDIVKRNRRNSKPLWTDL